MRRNILLGALLILLLTGCGTQQERPQPQNPVSTDEIVTLKAITLGVEPSGGLDVLYEQLDALTIPELGCILRFTYIPWGDERNQINLAVASGEYDFIPQGVFSDFQTLASRNAFLDIKPYLSLVPDLVEHYQRTGSDILAAAETDGKLYRIPQYNSPGISASEGFFYREDLRIQWGLEPVTSLETMEAYLYRAKEDPAFRDKPLITDNRFWTGLWSALTKDIYFEIADTPYAACMIDDPGLLLNRLETPEFRTMLEYIQKWHRDGILDKRLLTLSDNEGTAGRTLLINGEKPCETNSPLWSLNANWLPKLTEAHPEWTYGFFPYDSGGRRLQYKTGTSQASSISISSRTKYPEIAVRLLEKLHTDSRYYDLLCLGVEGVHYTMEDGVISHENIDADARYRGWTAGWDTFQGYPETYCDNEDWTERVYLPHMAFYEELAESVPFHPLNDFHFIAGPVSAQADALSEAWNTYVMPMLCGLSEDIDAGLHTAAVRLEEAGLAEYMEELQRQLTAFLQQSDQ